MTRIRIMGFRCVTDGDGLVGPGEPQSAAELVQVPVRRVAEQGARYRAQLVGRRVLGRDAETLPDLEIRLAVQIRRLDVTERLWLAVGEKKQSTARRTTDL